MDLPPGFRFHPTDEELISHYLYKKVLDSNFSARAIGDVDLNKSEPWDLPCKLKLNKPNQVFRLSWDWSLRISRSFYQISSFKIKKKLLDPFFFFTFFHL
jgi:hypothetical protein